MVTALQDHKCQHYCKYITKTLIKILILINAKQLWSINYTTEYYPVIWEFYIYKIKTYIHPCCYKDGTELGEEGEGLMLSEVREEEGTDIE